MKKVYQPAKFSAKNIANGVFAIENKFAFANLATYQLQWQLTADGSEVASGFKAMPDIAAGEIKLVALPEVLQHLPKQSAKEYFITLKMVVDKPQALLEKGP